MGVADGLLGLLAHLGAPIVGAMKRFALAAVAALLVGQGLGCTSPAPVAPVALALPGSSAFGGGVTVRGSVALRPGYVLLGGGDGVSPWVASNVNRVEVYLRPLVGGAAEFHLGSLPNTTLPIELRNLKRNTDYEVRLEAFDAEVGGVQIDKGASHSISLVEVDDVAEINGLSFALALADKDFSGQASGNVAVTPGSVLDPVSTEALAPLPPTVPAGWSPLFLVRDDGPDAPILFDGGNMGVAPYHSPYFACGGNGAFFNLLSAVPGETMPAIQNGELIQVQVRHYTCLQP